jgi:competence protein ComEC
MGGLLLPAALAGVAAGILLGDGELFASTWTLLLPLAGVTLALAGAVSRQPRIGALGAALLAMQLGAWRISGAALPAGADSVAAHIDGLQHAISGLAVEDPRPRGERQQVVLEDVVLADGDAPLPVQGRLLAWLPRGVTVEAGARVAFEGALREPRDFDGFAYREYLARQGIGATTSAYRAIVMPGSRGALVDALGAVRRTLLHGLLTLVPEPEGALGAGILLGVRSGMAPQVSDAFTAAGLTHVVAISGWNIAIVAALIGSMTRPLLRLRGGRLLAVAMATLAVGAYVLVTGASPSVVRAALMAAALLFARLGGSPAHAISALMAAALGMLLVAPQVLWDVGFQLSALATAGLIWFSAPLEARLAGWPGLLREPVALTLAAQLTTLPVILLNFERLSLISPLANVVVVPLVPVVMGCSAVAAAVGALDGAVHVPLLGDAAAWAAGGSAWLYLRAMILAGQAAAAVPFASVSLAAPAWLAGAWYPLLLALHRRWSRGTVPGATSLPAVSLVRPLPTLALTVLLLALLTLASQPDGRLHLLMLDVGQGDAILVHAPDGATLLVDGGPDPDLAVRRLGEALPFWQRTIDVVIMTHPHEDHVAGLVPALERYRVSTILEPGRDYGNPTYATFRALAASEPGAANLLARAGMVLALGATTRLTILYPSEADAEAPLPEGDINNASVVALLADGSFRALLTGDAEAPVEARLLARGQAMPVDVLKVGHHGSDSSSTPTFLAAVRPRLALISAGAGNEYGHPHQITLEHLAALDGIEIRRTDRDGTVEVVVDAAGWHVAREGSIGPWPFQTASARRRSWPRTSCRRGSCAIRAGWPGWLGRRRAWCPRPASRWMPRWSRPPPCCTTSTSRIPVGRSSMGSRRRPP